jgi:uncharacterized protein YjbI with pentapeptide repeats
MLPTELHVLTDEQLVELIHSFTTRNVALDPRLVAFIKTRPSLWPKIAEGILAKATGQENPLVFESLPFQVFLAYETTLGMSPPPFLAGYIASAHAAKNMRNKRIVQFNPNVKVRTLKSESDPKPEDYHDKNLRDKDFMYKIFGDGSNFENAAVYKTSFYNAVLRSAEFSSAVLRYINFSKADLRSAKFCYATLMHVDFSEANLYGMGFIKMDFSNATLTHVDFTGTDLRGVNFSNAKLNHVNLSGTDLFGANFFDARFENSDLARVQFSGAMLMGATFKYTENQIYPVEYLCSVGNNARETAVLLLESYRSRNPGDEILCRFITKLTALGCDQGSNFDELYKEYTSFNNRDVVTWFWHTVTPSRWDSVFKILAFAKHTSAILASRKASPPDPIQVAAPALTVS